MFGKAFWNPIRNPDMSGFSRTFGLWIDFNDLHFTDLTNVSPLIVRTSYDSNKIKTP
jgi:hypothetical protein